MQCAAIAMRTGVRCRRRVTPGARYCAFHLDARICAAEEAGAVTSDASIQPRAAVLATEDLPAGIGIEAEIAMLRRQIRVAQQTGDPEGARRGIETLIKAVKVQHVIAGRSEESLAASLSRVLEEVGAELGTTL